MVVREVSHENCVRRVPCAPVYADIRMKRVLIFFAGGPLGIFGPILLILVCLWLGRGERSPWYVKAVLLVLLILLLLIALGYI